MSFDDSYFGLPFAGSLTDHMFEGNSSLQATVNPADILLTQSSHFPTPHIVAASDGIVGYPAVGDILPETLHHHPPVRSSESMSNPPNLPFDINANSMRQFTGAMRTPRRMFRGIRVDNTVSTICQWESQGSICGREISGKAVPEHLASHGIRNMHRDCIAQCCWRECGARITRQSFTRHFREVHLGIERGSSARAASATLVASCPFSGMWL